MRTLKFIVDNQMIKQDPDCDFDNLIPGTEGYLRAEFSFSPEWNGFKKVVAFYSALGNSYTPQLLLDGKTCDIPFEALKKRVFKLQVLGERSGLKIRTNKLDINQNGDRL